GYSSLSYLSALPLDALKIDRSFVSNIIDDKKNQSITKAIIGLSHSLGLKVVAEGVETIAQQHFLMDNGCDAMQGFLLSKPLPAKDIEALL
ncbi:EAL domain-containing protein, partial [Oleiphilus sp. HI0066]